MPQIRQSGNWSVANVFVISGGSFSGTVTLSVNQVTVNVAALFGSSWTTNINKTLIINSGIVIGSPLISAYPLYINPNLSGTFTLINYGSIQGAGGAANSGTGGNAIYAGSAVSINNQGTIYAGGGGGGLGGTGGQGYQTYSYDCNCHDCCDCGCCNTCCYKNGCHCCGKQGQCCNCYTCCDTCYANNYYAGGAGGSGGVGQGYARNNTSGAGGAAGGTNAGSGGTGGNGGTFGNAGGTGGTGANGNYTNGSAGSAGGLAGYYIVNNGNVTWINTGTVAGRVG